MNATTATKYTVGQTLHSREDYWVRDDNGVRRETGWVARTITRVGRKYLYLDTPGNDIAVLIETGIDPDNQNRFYTDAEKADFELRESDAQRFHEATGAPRYPMTWFTHDLDAEQRAAILAIVEA